MSFVAEFNSLPLAGLVRKSLACDAATAQAAAAKPNPALADFAALISPAAGGLLETLGRRAQALTRQRFGRVIRMFAPLYLSLIHI